MSGVTLTNPRYDYSGLSPGHFLRVSGCQPRSWVVLKVDSATTLTIAPWTWISAVISWNPCNSLELAAGAWK